MKIAIFWFRRDLRLEDNAGLFHALKGNYPVLPVFIFDQNILEKLLPNDPRVVFIHQNLQFLKQELRKLGSDLLVKHGKPFEIWQEILAKYQVQEVFTNHDYEPYARQRDAKLQDLLTAKNIRFRTFKDQTIFDTHEVLKNDGKPYTVFSPYAKKWKQTLTDFYLRSYPTEQYFYNFFKIADLHFPSLRMLGFQEIQSIFPPKNLPQIILEHYANRRNFPAISGTSRLSVHLRFGTISIRKIASKALEISEIYLNELIWRDFYMMILWHFPHVTERAFKPAYDRIIWRNHPEDFEAWKNGKTGYPIVDAGMRELNKTNFMHNRVRMITASFLTKHLLIDWRWGEAYFAEKLLDFDLSANNGGWQWASGSGCDAAPYFRVFNPTLQTQKFDKNFEYIRTWVPEFQDLTYHRPMIDHKFARERALETYKLALKS